MYAGMLAYDAVNPYAVAGPKARDCHVVFQKRTKVSTNDAVMMST